MTVDMPKLSDYCDWATDAKLVSIGDLDLYFSYRTCVAFRWHGGLVCSENVWSKTTGRHLNSICPKKRRVPNETFERALVGMLSEMSRTAVTQG